MGEMDRQALDVVLSQLDKGGRQALRHLLSNAVFPLSLALDFEPGPDHEAAEDAVTRINAIVSALGE